MFHSHLGGFFTSSTLTHCYRRSLATVGWTMPCSIVCLECHTNLSLSPEDHSQLEPLPGLTTTPSELVSAVGDVSWGEVVEDVLTRLLLFFVAFLNITNKFDLLWATKVFRGAKSDMLTSSFISISFSWPSATVQLASLTEGLCRGCLITFSTLSWLSSRR